MDWSLFLTYSGYVLFILGTIFSVYKIRYETHKRKELEELLSMREKRFTIYKDFLSKLDVMNSELYDEQFNEASIRKINELIEQIKLNPENISGYYDIIQYQANILFEWIRKYNKYLDELNQIRLVGSKELVSMLDNYQTKVKDYLEANAQALLMYHTSLPGHFDFSVLSNYVKSQEELNNIRKNIEKQMRIDIGNK